MKPMDRLREHVRRGSEQAREVVKGPALAHLARRMKFGGKRCGKTANVETEGGRESREAGA